MSSDSEKLERVVMGRRPTVPFTPGGATFVEGVVHHMGGDDGGSRATGGMYFTVPAWDNSAYIFGPCPWPMSRVEPTLIDITIGDNTVPSTVVDPHPGLNDASHSHTITGGSTGASTVPLSARTHDTHDHGEHSHSTVIDPHNHDHIETEPEPGDRCLVLFPTVDNDGIQQPWVIGWWPGNG